MSTNPNYDGFIILALEAFMEPIKQIILTSATGFQVKVLNLGGIITHIMANNKDYIRENVVLHYDNLEDYNQNPLYLGCVVGPISGRTKNGQFQINEQKIQLDISQNPSGLHSGKNGLNYVIWKIEHQSHDKLVLSYKGPLADHTDIEINYQLTYTVMDESLIIDYNATASNPAYLSLTNHSYFNLTGSENNSIEAQILTLNCSHFAKLDTETLPISLTICEGSLFDFSKSKSLKSVLNSESEDVKNVNGIDHPFKCIANTVVAKLNDPKSGRQMTVSTTQPYIVIYTGNFLHTAQSNSGKSFEKHHAICFETQDLPDVLNSEFDLVKLVTPEQPYVHQTVFDFSTK